MVVLGPVSLGTRVGLLWSLLLLAALLRVERLEARAEMRRLRSSRSSDFRGET